MSYSAATQQGALWLFQPHPVELSCRPSMHVWVKKSSWNCDYCLKEAQHRCKDRLFPLCLFWLFPPLSQSLALLSASVFMHVIALPLVSSLFVLLILSLSLLSHHSLFRWLPVSSVSVHICLCSGFSPRLKQFTLTSIVSALTLFTPDGLFPTLLMLLSFTSCYLMCRSLSSASGERSVGSPEAFPNPAFTNN